MENYSASFPKRPHPDEWNSATEELAIAFVMKQEKVVNRVITDLVEEVSDDLTAKLDHDTKVVQRLKIRQMMRMRSQGASFADIAKRFYPEDDLAVATGRVRTQVNRIVKELRKKVDEKEGLTDEVLNNVL